MLLIAPAWSATHPSPLPHAGRRLRGVFVALLGQLGAQVHHLVGQGLDPALTGGRLSSQDAQLGVLTGDYLPERQGFLQELSAGLLHLDLLPKGQV